MNPINYLELVIASIRLLFIFFCVLICIEILTKSREKLAKMIIFFIIAFIPSTLYTLGSILNIENLSENGKFLNLSMNLFNTIFLFLGLITLNSLVKEARNEIPKKMTPKDSYRVPQARIKKPKRRMIILRNS